MAWDDAPEHAQVDETVWERQPKSTEKLPILPLCKGCCCPSQRPLLSPPATGLRRKFIPFIPFYTFKVLSHPLSIFNPYPRICLLVLGREEGGRKRETDRQTDIDVRETH